METKGRQPSSVGRETPTWWGPGPGLMAIAVAVSWVAMLAHNLYELPLTPWDVENSGPLVVDVLLLVAYWRRPADG